MVLSIGIVPLLFLCTGLNEKGSGTSLNFKFVKTSLVDWSGFYQSLLKRNALENYLS